MDVSLQLMDYVYISEWKCDEYMSVTPASIISIDEHRNAWARKTYKQTVIIFSFFHAFVIKYEMLFIWLLQSSYTRESIEIAIK